MNLQSIFSFALLLVLSTALPPAHNTGLSFGGKWPSHPYINSTSETYNVSTTPCAGNTPNDRSSWCNYNISTDYEKVVPHTGVVREYWLYVNDLYIQPDGYHNRSVITVNGTIPGPTLFADWGDEVIVHVKNNITSRIGNGTSIHFHGLRQLNTNQMDGVVSLTQCPIPPQLDSKSPDLDLKSSMTYRWHATQYGSSWYHSHIGLQAWEGVFGGIIINGPASADYDEDKGLLFLNDWTYRTPDELYFQEMTGLGRFIQYTGLLNGTARYEDKESDVRTGHNFIANVTQGKSYRFRLVNAAIDSNYEFRVDHHNLTVIATDFVPIKPYNTTSVHVSMGQRYDVILHADQAALNDTFWIQAISQICGENPMNTVRGILWYGQRELPENMDATPQDPDQTDCLDEPVNLLQPIVKKNVGPVSSPSWNKTIQTSLQNLTSTGFYNWYLNHTDMKVNWSDPTLGQIYRKKSLKNTVGPFNPDKWLNASNMIDLPRKDEWVYVNIESDRYTDAEAHPIHLHGHDFYILSQGNFTFNGAINTKNPPRRDTALLPALGHLVIAFKTDNPGVWLMHCHIGWHNAEGFSLQFLERKNEIRHLIDYPLLNHTCTAWDDYARRTGANKELEFDSGV